MLQPASPSLSHFCLCPPSLTHPLTPDFLLFLSPPLPPCPPSIFFPPSSLLLLFSLSLSPLCLRLPPSHPSSLSSAAEVNTTRRQVNTPSLLLFFFFFLPSSPHWVERRRRIEVRYINAAITACLSTGGGDDGGRGVVSSFSSLFHTKYISVSVV